MILLFSLIFSFVKAGSQLEIHFFDVGQGDAQLIVFPSGYSILIDAGETSSSSRNCKTVAERVKSILGGTHVDVGVMSHLHTDHYGYPFTNGLWYVLESSGLTFGKFIDRDYGTVKSGFTNCQSATVDNIDWKNVGSSSSSAAKWVCYATNTALSTKIKGIREAAKMCGNQISPSDSGADVEIFISDAAGIKSNGKSLQGDHRSDSTPPSENDYSVGLRIQYGDFVYATAGDLDGEDHNSYHDIETTYKDVVGEVDLYKVNHHGSSHSNNKNWMNKLKPTVSVISCGQGNSYNHPTSEAMEIISGVSNKIYLTEDCNSGVTDSYSNVKITNDEIIVKYTKGSSTFTVTTYGGSFTHTYNVKTGKVPESSGTNPNNSHDTSSGSSLSMMTQIFTFFFLILFF